MSARRPICGPRRPRAAVLLESIISLAIFLSVAAFVLTASRQSLESARAAALEARGADLARSALAAIDAGLVPTAALDGGDDLLEAIGFIDPDTDMDAFAPDTGRWALDVLIDPSEFAELSLATVIATWVPAGADIGGPGGGGGDPEGAPEAQAGDAAVRVVLRGLVRLSDADAWAPEEDDLLEGLPAAPDGGGP